MRIFLVMGVGFSLFCTIDSLLVDRSHHAKLQKDFRDDEDMVLVSGVPVYHYNRALQEARDALAKRSFLLNTSSGESEYPDKDLNVSWIVMFHSNVTEEILDKFCPFGETGEGSKCNITDGTISGTICEEVIFKNCRQHGNVTATDTHSKGIAYLHVICKKSELEEALANKEVQKYVFFAEMDMSVSLSDDHMDYSQYLIDDSEQAATWGLNRIKKDLAQAAGFGVHVYVLDTGVRTTHSQFEGRAIPQVESLGSVRKCECQNTSCAMDTHGHGTHCAGTIGGVTFGVAPQTRIHAIKVLGDDGYGFTSWSIAAESWIISSRMSPAIVSMSLGGPGNNYAEKASIDAMVADGIPVIVASGNEADNACNYNPSWVTSAITVGSTTSSDGLSWFSNYGTCVDILAPGHSILSAGITSDTATAYKSGTSMACPHVSGAVSILFALNGSMTPEQIITELITKAESGSINNVPSGTPNLLLQVDTLSGR